jgi:hypothetical protein
MIYTAAGGLGAVGGYTFPTTSNFPAPIGCTLTSPTLTCLASSNISATAATYHPTVTAVDVANAATTVANTTTDPGSIRPGTDTLIVDAPLSVRLTQATSGSTTATNPTNLLAAVAGRTYGTPTGTPTYNAAGGLGATTVADYEWCVKSGSLPLGLVGIGTSCSSYTTTGAAMETLSANPIGSGVTPGLFSFSVEVDDTGNTATPSSVASATSATRGTQLQVIPPCRSGPTSPVPSRTRW